jgi:hypothetical protein
MPLHWGSAPRWLFGRMVRLCRAVTDIIVADYGPQEILHRFSDPVWFQSFGCVLGFDWHSSGVTTTVCGALKEAARGREADLGFYVCGGKGAASRKTPEELNEFAERFGLDGDELVRTSRLVAKVDSAGLQDGYQIYHHVFLGTNGGDWAVVQQGMNTTSRMARRYHWQSGAVQDPVSDPHSGVACDRVGRPLNMVAAEAGRARDAVTELAGLSPDRNVKELERVRRLTMPRPHPVGLADVNPRHLAKALVRTYEKPPADFVELLLMPGIGAKTIRALALIAEVTHGAPLSFRDPVTYSFAVGGKDGYPFPVDRRAYDQSVAFMENGIREARLGNRDRLDMLRRLERWSRAVAANP